MTATMTKLEQLHARMEELLVIIKQKNEAFIGSPEDTGWDAYEENTRLEQKEYDKLSRQYRVLVDANLFEWDGKGKMMSLDEFVKNVNSGGFIDYDGYGNYSDGVQKSDVSIYPSDVKVGNYRKDFTHVIWYNR
jgi:hypothetical protein